MLDSSQFTWHSESRTFVCDASDLNEENFGKGITIRSSRNGKVCNFYLDEIERDVENDILRWIFRPTPEALRAVPGLAGVTVQIFND